MNPTEPVVWITGATSGIGKAVAEAFAREHATVAISGRNRDALFGLANRLDAEGYRAVPVPCDVRSDEEVAAAAGTITTTLGGVDVLVNNAGVTVFKSFLDSTVKDFDEIVDTNLRGAFLCTKAVLPGMLARRSGMIVMINSVTSKYEFINSAVYGASKLGLRGMTDVLRKEVRSQGIRLLTVYPGATDTNIWSPAVRGKHAARMMQPPVVAEAIIEAWKKPAHIMVEEILLRPITGDL